MRENEMKKKKYGKQMILTLESIKKEMHQYREISSSPAKHFTKSERSNA